MDIRPFRALRPPRDKAHLVATRSYVTYEEEKLKDKLLNNPFSFLQVIHPDQFGATVTQGPARYRKVRSRFHDFRREGVFSMEERPAFYIYQQVHEQRCFTGVVAAARVSDYKEGRILRHEHTLPHREEIFSSYLSETGFNAEPVLLSHRPLPDLERLLADIMADRAEYEFTTTDRVKHLLWPVTSADLVERIMRCYQAVEQLYIADGHHRISSSTLLNERSPNEMNQRFMALLMSERELHLSPFSRIVSRGKETKEEVFHSLAARFELQASKGPRELSAGEYQIYAERSWWDLKLRTQASEPTEEKLPAELFSRYVLAEVFAIMDERTDPRLTFIPDTDLGQSMKEKVDASKDSFGFRMPRPSIDDIRSVADAGQVMPPKSTYVEPKLRSGLLVYSLEDV